MVIRPGGVVGLVVLDKTPGVIPNSRFIFWKELDPEQVAFTLLFLSLSCCLAGRFAAGWVLLFLTNLVHPLYAAPIMGALVILFFIRWQWKKHTFAETALLAGAYALAVVPYAFWLWIRGRPGADAPFDASMILEIVRSPHHHFIPTLFTPSYFISSPFFRLAVVLLLASWLLARYPGIRVASDRMQHDASKALAWLRMRKPMVELSGNAAQPIRADRRSVGDLTVVIGALLAFLLFASIVTSFVRVPLLIQLSPYRMGVVLIPVRFHRFFRLYRPAWAYPPSYHQQSPVAPRVFAA